MGASQPNAPVFAAIERDDAVALVFLVLLAGFYLLNQTIWNQKPKGFDLYFVSPQVQDGVATKVHSQKDEVKTRDINTKLAQSGSDVVIFWGSQSGTAQKLANTLARECRKQCGIQSIAVDLDDVDHEHLTSFPENKYVIFVVSTFGEGDPPDNAAGLHQYLVKLQHQKQLRNLQYFAFGLGNSKYQYFNRFVDVLDEALTEAGARRLGHVGKADEALRSNTAWLTWKETVLTELSAKLQKKKKKEPSHGALSDPEFGVVDCPDHGSSGQFVYMGEQSFRSGHTQSTQVAAPILLFRMLSPNSSSRKYLHIEFDARNLPVSYQVGDHVAVWPVNPEEEVYRFAGLFGWDIEKLQSVVTIKQHGNDQDISSPVPSPTTREALLRHYLDICGPVSQEITQILVRHAPTAESKEFLESFMQKDQDSWFATVDSNYMTVSKLMRLSTPWTGTIWPARLFDSLVERLPTLQPRYFSISSSPEMDPNRLGITVSVLTEDIESTNQKFYGLATNYLDAVCKSIGQNISNGVSVPSEPEQPKYALNGPRDSLLHGKALIHIRPSSFKPPDKPSCPIIMIAAGSGIAPFRGFVHDRVKHALQHTEDDVGRMLLFFGCRSPKEDFLYEKEWDEIKQSLLARGKESLFDIDCAFSRFGPSSNGASDGRGIYVQDRVSSRKEEVLKFLLEENASLYICGSIKLSTGVKDTLKQALTSANRWDLERGGKYIEDLKACGRLKEDVWA